VRILEGATHLSALSDRESRLAIELGFGPDERLACLTCVFGPVVVTTSYW
jgi:ferredoxin